jgi:hypothetical protein
MPIEFGRSVETPLLASPLADADSTRLLEAIEETRNGRSRDLAAALRDEALLAGLTDGSVTPEMLLEVARRRLHDLDGQVETVIGALNERTVQATELQRRLGTLREIQTNLSDAYDANGRVDGNNVVEGVTIVNASGATVTNPTVNEYLDWLEDQNIISAEERSAIGATRDGLQGLIDGTNEDLRGVNSGNELLMIQLQSTMQTRTSVIQATSNLLKTIDEGNDAVVANLR